MFVIKIVGVTILGILGLSLKTLLDRKLFVHGQPQLKSAKPVCPLAHGLEFLNPKPLRNGARVVFFENDFKRVLVKSVVRLSPFARDFKQSRLRCA